jgi:uncharacterized membrane protein
VKARRNAVRKNAPRLAAALSHVGFEAAILLKGIHASLEMVGGVLLWLVKPDTLNAWLRLLTQNELAEDPADIVANLVVRAGQKYTVDTQSFTVFYLLSHGLVKIVLVLLLWRRKLWAYPVGVGVLALFIAYQVFRWTSTHSFFLIFLSVFDALIIWLTLLEYARLRKTRSEASKVEPPAA